VYKTQLLATRSRRKSTIVQRLTTEVATDSTIERKQVNFKPEVSGCKRPESSSRDWTCPLTLARQRSWDWSTSDEFTVVRGWSGMKLSASFHRLQAAVYWLAEIAYNFRWLLTVLKITCAVSAIQDAKNSTSTGEKFSFISANGHLALPLFYCTPSVGVQSVAMCMSVCLSICLFTHISR